MANNFTFKSYANGSPTFKTGGYVETIPKNPTVIKLPSNIIGLRTTDVLFYIDLGSGDSATVDTTATGGSLNVYNSLNQADVLFADMNAVFTGNGEAYKAALAQTYQAVTAATYAAALTMATGSQKKLITVTYDSDVDNVGDYLYKGVAGQITHITGLSKNQRIALKQLLPTT